MTNDQAKNVRERLIKVLLHWLYKADAEYSTDAIMQHVKEIPCPCLLATDEFHPKCYCAGTGTLYILNLPEKE